MFSRASKHPPYLATADWKASNKVHFDESCIFVSGKVLATPLDSHFRRHVTVITLPSALQGGICLAFLSLRLPLSRFLFFFGDAIEVCFCRNAATVQGKVASDLSVLALSLK